MQKNLPKYAPEWIQSVSMWAEASHRDVAYALCNDRRTLLWFGNQRAVEYHVTLVRRSAGTVRRTSSWTLIHQRAHRSPPRCTPRIWFARCSPTSGSTPRSRPVVPRGCTSSFVETAHRYGGCRRPRREPSRPARNVRSGGDDDRVHQGRPRRSGVPRLHASRRCDGGRGLQPWARPGVPGSFPVAWDALDSVSPGDFTIRSATRMIAGDDPWRTLMPPARHCPTIWSPRATRSRLPGSRQCTRASAGPALSARCEFSRLLSRSM